MGRRRLKTAADCGGSGKERWWCVDSIAASRASAVGRCRENDLLPVVRDRVRAFVSLRREEGAGHLTVGVVNRCGREEEMLPASCLLLA